MNSEKIENAVCHTPDSETAEYILNQTMYRIKDPVMSLDFYTRILGMKLVTKRDFPEMKFSLYFLTTLFADEKIPEEQNARMVWMASHRSVLELTHNWGTEDDSQQHYHNGNDEPRGFGHIGLSVPDVDAACARFEELGVEFVKKPSDGKMKTIAFIKDPDGYWIEILGQKNAI